MATNNGLIYSIGFEAEDKATPVVKTLGKELDNVQRSAASVSEQLKLTNAPKGIGEVGGKAIDASHKFNSLNMSVQQITRELPSMTMGANMFFLAISNNLPILADNIKAVREENAALIASGQKATPVWKQVAGSFLSWQTAMVVGITLLSAYGTQIIDAVSGLVKGKSATDDIKRSQESLNEALKKGTEDAQKDVIHLRLLYNATQDHTKALDERKEAVKGLKKEYPSYFKNMSDEFIMAGKAKDAYDKLATSIVKVAQARAIEDKLVENEKKALDNESKMAAMQQKYNESKKALSQQKPINAYQPGAGLYELQGMGSAYKTYKEYNELVQKTKELRAENERLSKSIDTKALANGNPKSSTTGENTEAVNKNLATIGGIENKIQELQQRQSKAMGDEAIALEKQIELWQKKLDIMRNTVIVGAQEKPVLTQIEASPEGLDLKKMKSQNRVTDKENGSLIIPATVDEKKLKEAAKQAQKNMVLAMGNKDKYAPAVEGINSVADALGMMSGALGDSAGSWLQWGANVMQTIAMAIPRIIALTNTSIASSQAQVTANTATAATGAAASVAAVPVVGWIMAGAAVASVIAMLAAIPKPKKLASGALAYSTALVQVGEYAGAGHNPEVIAPLDKIRSMINPQQSMNNMRLETLIRGNDLYVVLKKVAYKQSRTR